MSDLSFYVKERERFFIVGPNGSGKSTLLKLIARILTGVGEVKVEDQAISDFPSKELAKTLAYVPQAGGQIPPFSVEEFVLMGRYPHLGPFAQLSKEDYETARVSMELAGVIDFKERALEKLSGGERQKAHIAAAIAQGAKIMLLDEPTAFLDPASQQEIMGVLKLLNHERGITQVHVTHDINQAALFGDTILGLNGGRTVFFGDATEFMTQKSLYDIYGREFTITPHPVTGAPMVAPDVE